MGCALRPGRPAGLTAVAALAILLSGCAGTTDEPGDAGSGTGDPRPTKSPTETPTGDDDQTEAPGEATPTSVPEADVSEEIEIIDGKVYPPPGRVQVSPGDKVRIDVTSDQPDTVHVHGYDVEAAVSPSAPAVLEFIADQPGLFEVETHESGLLLTQLVVE